MLINTSNYLKFMKSMINLTLKEIIHLMYCPVLPSLVSKLSLSALKSLSVNNEQNYSRLLAEAPPLNYL